MRINCAGISVLRFAHFLFIVCVCVLCLCLLRLLHIIIYRGGHPMATGTTAYRKHLNIVQLSHTSLKLFVTTHKPQWEHTQLESAEMDLRTWTGGELSAHVCIICRHSLNHPDHPVRTGHTRIHMPHPAGRHIYTLCSLRRQMCVLRSVCGDAPVCKHILCCLL